MVKHRSAVMAGMVIALAGMCYADWPQYLGPERNATSTETGLARSWPAEGPQVLWTIPMGKGYGGAAVSGDKVYVLDREGNETDILRCLDLETGQEQWTFSYAAPGRLSHAGARVVPAIDGDSIYICGPFGDLHCVNANTHQSVWSTNIWRDFGGGRLPRWALAQNPLVYGDLVIVAIQTPEAGVVAFDKSTGEVRWASAAFRGRAGYVSPTVVTIAGMDQIVAISAGNPRRGIFRRGGRAAQDPPQDAKPPDAEQEQGDGAVMGIDPETGDVLWAYHGWQCQTPVPNVTALGDDRLFVTGGYRAGSALIRVTKHQNAFEITELLKTQAFGSHIHPAIHYQGHLYGQCTTNTGRDDGMVCMDLEGNVKWQTGHSPFFDKGGRILADGMLISVDGRDGFLYLIDPSPEAFKPLAKAKLLDTQTCWAPLALCDGKLLIRDQKQMKCIDLR